MKKHLPYLLLSVALFASHTLSAQLVVDPSPVFTTVNEAVFESVGYSFVINNADGAIDCEWERNVVSITDGWESAVCDKNLCHSWPVSSAQFTLDAGESGTLDVHVYPFNNPGGAIIEVSVTEIGNPDNTDTGVFYFNETTSVAERLRDVVKLYPNPTTDFLFIEKGDHDDIAEVAFFNLRGQNVLQVAINQSQMIDMGRLPAGTYVARLFNNNGEHVSSNVVMKQ